MKKKKIANNLQILSPENYIRQKSRNLPVSKCYITKEWEETQMAQITIVREHVSGNVTACLYLVDLSCLGIKDTTYKFNISFDEFEDLLDVYRDNGAEFIEIPYELAHNIIYAAVDYAEEYGFKPHKDFTSTTVCFLEEDTDDIPLIDIKCGDDDGNPVYVNSGFDSPARVKQIVSQLEKTAGKDNYRIVIPGEDGEDEFDDEEKDETDEIMEEIERMNKDEQKKLFIDLIKKGESDTVSEMDAKRMMAVINILSYDLTGDKAVGEQLDILEKKFEHTIVEEEELPNSLFTDVQNMDGETVADLFATAIDSIMNNVHPQKTITAFRKETGDVPVADFLELFYLEHNKNKKFEQKLKEAAQKHPCYLLIQTYSSSILQHEETDTVKEKLEKLLYNEKQPVTCFEANIFFLIYVVHLVLDKGLDVTAILAFEEYLKQLDAISDETFYRISSILQIAKIRKLVAHFEHTGELQPLEHKPAIKIREKQLWH